VVQLSEIDCADDGEGIMNRREFVQGLGLGILGPGLLGPGFSAKKPSAVSKSEKKQWAAEYLKGMENLFMPSFSSDFKDWMKREYAMT